MCLGYAYTKNSIFVLWFGCKKSSISLSPLCPKKASLASSGLEKFMKQNYNLSSVYLASYSLYFKHNEVIVPYLENAFLISSSVTPDLIPLKWRLVLLLVL